VRFINFDVVVTFGMRQHLANFGLWPITSIVSLSNGYDQRLMYLLTVYEEMRARLLFLPVKNSDNFTSNKTLRPGSVVI